MFTKKLFGGVAAAALVSLTVSGVAHAQVALTVDAATNGNLPVRGTAVNGADTTGFVAAEFQPALAADQLTGKLVVDTTFGAVAPFAAIPVNNRVSLTVTLSNATFTSASAGTADNTAADKDCKFAPAAVAGGGIGSSSVTFLSDVGSTLNACKAASSKFTFDGIKRTANGSNVGVTFAYTQVDAAGAAVANPVTTSKAVSLAQPSAAWGTVAANHKFTAGAEILASSKGIITAGAKTLGEIQVSLVTVADASTDKSAANKAIGVGASGGAQITAGALFKDTGKLVLTFPQGAANLGTFTVTGPAVVCGAPVTTTAPAQTVTCTLTAAQLGGLTTKSTVTATRVDDKTATPEQTVTAVLTTVTQDNYVAAGFSGNFAPIKHDDGLRTGVIGATYDWVAFGPANSESQFRISGMTADQTNSVQQVRVAVDQGGNGVSVPTNPAYYTLTNTGNVDTGFRVLGQTIVFTSKALGVAAGLAVGATGNANVTGFTLQFQETGMGGATLPGTAKIDRQVVNRAPSTLVAVPYDN